MKNQKIIKICEQKFIYLNYSPRTKENYISHIKHFIDSMGDKQIIHCSSDDFKNYLNNYKFTSISQQNQVINSIRFLYKEVLGKKYDKVSFKRPKSEKKLPKEEFNKLCAKFLNWKLEDGYYNKDMNHEYSFVEPHNLKFHSDWNWIMEVIEKIAYMAVNKNIEFPILSYPIFSPKEAVVEAIWKFLQSYNKQKQ